MSSVDLLPNTMNDFSELVPNTMNDFNELITHGLHFTDKKVIVSRHPPDQRGTDNNLKD